MWLVQSNMAGYMGLPEPELMTCFSTMNERGVCGGFLGIAMLPMILNRRWRNIGGYFSVVLILYAIFLTQVRTIMIILVLVTVLQPVLARGYGLGRVLAATIILTLVSAFGLAKMPGTSKFAARFEAEQLAGKNTSMEGRFGVYGAGLGTILSNPMGQGLGSAGMAANRLPGEGGKLGDAGYVEIVVQFGWLGSALFFGGLALLWKELAWRWNFAHRLSGIYPVDPFLPAGRAMFFGALAYLLIGDIFAGFSLIWVFFGRALNLCNHPAVVEAYLESTEPEEEMEASPRATL
jgi:hypothetical protein